jgi:hypothetical protein
VCMSCVADVVVHGLPYMPHTLSIAVQGLKDPARFFKSLFQLLCLLLVCLAAEPLAMGEGTHTRFQHGRHDRAVLGSVNTSAGAEPHTAGHLTWWLPDHPTQLEWSQGCLQDGYGQVCIMI